MSKKILIGLFGTGGFAREVMPFSIEYINSIFHMHPKDNINIYYVSIDNEDTEINGIPVISEQKFLTMDCDDRFFNVAIGDILTREKIAIKCIDQGIKPLNLISNSSIIYDRNYSYEGIIVCPLSIITSDVRIGKFFHANIYSYVAHDCVIGDFVTFSPKVCCNGNVHIHSYASIGTCAILKPGTPDKPLIIGEGAVIGMGAIVTKDVAPYTTVVGNPARPIKPA